MYYLITWHETDGNDCTVYDSIVAAGDESAALGTLAAAVERELTGPYSDDGSEFGYYFECPDDCDGGEFCEGHGGIALRTVDAYPTLAEAQNNRSRWHLQYHVDAVSK